MRGQRVGCEDASEYIRWVKKNYYSVGQDQDGKWITINKKGVKVTLKSK
jgi:hypothetical protein